MEWNNKMIKFETIYDSLTLLALGVVIWALIHGEFPKDWASCKTIVFGSSYIRPDTSSLNDISFADWYLSMHPGKNLSMSQIQPFWHVQGSWLDVFSSKSIRTMSLPLYKCLHAPSTMNVFEVLTFCSCKSPAQLFLALSTGIVHEEPWHHSCRLCKFYSRQVASNFAPIYIGTNWKKAVCLFACMLGMFKLSVIYAHQNLVALLCEPLILAIASVPLDPPGQPISVSGLLVCDSTSARLSRFTRRPNANNSWLHGWR